MEGRKERKTSPKWRVLKENKKKSKSTKQTGKKGHRRTFNPTNQREQQKERWCERRATEGPGGKNKIGVQIPEKGKNKTERNLTSAPETIKKRGEKKMRGVWDMAGLVSAGQTRKNGGKRREQSDEQGSVESTTKTWKQIAAQHKKTKRDGRKRK